METKIDNVIIESVHWSNEPVLTNYISVKGDGWGVGFGGYCLTGIACYHWINQIMETLEIDHFDGDKMKGMIVRLKHQGWGGKAIAIGHPYKDRWIEPKTYFEELRKEKGLE